MLTLTGPGWTLLQADYRETCAYVAEQGGADLFAFSPPYCDARTYGANVSWTDADYATLGDAVFAALKPGGHALVNVDAPVRKWRRLCEPCGRMAPQGSTACPRCGGRLMADPTERGFHPWRLMLDWAERVGFRVVDRLAWIRDGAPGAYEGRFRNDWEPLIWFQKPGADGWLDRWALATRTAPMSKRASNRRADGTLYIRQASGKAAEEGWRHRGTVWQASNKQGQTGAPDIENTGHTARWPYRLAEDIVRCFCPPDGLVVDPFVGAGTTAAAAIAHGRRFIGGDPLCRVPSPERGLDGAPWVDVAARVLTERQRRQTPFRGEA